MSDNNNTIMGWVLAGGICALGFSIVSGKYFHADNPQRPEQLGMVIELPEGVGDEKDKGPSFEALLATADLAAGKKLFVKCQICHSINEGGADGTGPNLFAVMGKEIGQGGFRYSTALKSVGGQWTWSNMDAWLTKPSRFAKNTTMSYPGLSKVEDRANLIYYLNAQGSNLPLPPVPEGEKTPAEDLAEAGKSTQDPA